jgi:multicomponent K+:H+ antiporter subunit E
VKTLPRPGLLPQPLLSLVLLVVWLLVHNKVEAGTVLLGAALAWLIPLFTHRFWPDYPRLQSPRLAIRLVTVVLLDIAIANLRVAVLILSPVKRLRPRFIIIEVDLEHPLALTILTSIISLTPGTVSAQIGPQRRRILVHALDCPDEEAMVAEIKRRYEAPLKRIFGC